MSGTYIDCDVEHNDKYPKLKIGDQVRISKYKHIYEISYTLNCSEEVFWIKKLKMLCLRHMVLVISMLKALLERFMKKSCKRLAKKEDSTRTHLSGL